VPQAQFYQLRIDLSSAGLPSKGSPGWALLDKQGITTSEFRQRVDYQRALEGELANTIAAIDGVGTADVHLVIPKDDVFAGDATKPSASVLIRPTGSARLGSQQVQAVVHLVASSVEGLDAASVTVADSTGKVLSAPGTDLGAAGDAHAEQQAAFESHLGASLQTLLEPVVGAGHAVVRVSATLDFDKRSTKTETYQPDQGAPAVRETTTKEDYKGMSPTAGGVLGPSGTPTTDASGSNYTKEAAERSFAVSKVNEEVDSAPGAVQRLTVAVLLDRSKTKVQTRQVEDLVRAAAGLDATRGDAVQVTTADFDSTSVKAAEQAEAAASSAQRTGQLMAIGRSAGMVLLLLIVLFFGYRSARTATVNRVPLGLPAGSLGTLGASQGGHAAALALSAAMGPNASEGAAGLAPVLAEITGEAAAALPPAASRPAPVPVKSISDQANELVSSQPEDVAQMLRGWLGDRRG
jgi:flagellar M-ring protein FliF